MRIAIDISSLTSPIRTGVGEYTYEFLDALFRIDTQNQYFLFYNSFSDVSEFLPQWKQNNVQYVSLHWPNKLFHFFILFFQWPKLDTFLLKKMGIKDEKIDYFFSPNIGFFSLGTRTKSILMIHDLSFEIMPECFSWKMRWWHKILRPKKQCEKADIIITPSENTKRDVVDIYKIPENKIQVFYPGLAHSFFSVESKSLVQDPYIFFLGTLEPRKNILGVIQAFMESGVYKEGVRLVIAGAPGWRCKTLLSAIKRNSHIQYLHYVTPEQKSSLYKNAQVFVYPSLYEGFGFPVLEAMASNVPVITSNRSSLPEVTSGATYLVNPYNISEMAEGIQLLIRDQTLRHSFIAKGQERAKYFSWQETVHKFLDMIQAL